MWPKKKFIENKLQIPLFEYIVLRKTIFLNFILGLIAFHVYDLISTDCHFCD